MKHILIINDSLTSLHILSTQLEKYNFRVSTATSGEEGIYKAKVLLPDLILMNLIMPDISGFQATRILKKLNKTSHIPIVMESSNPPNGLDNDRAWAKRVGAADLIIGPFVEVELAKIVRKHLPETME